MTRRQFAGFIAILLLALSLRTVFPAADPPWRMSVGVVWHDEGAWVHNARNKALFGGWRQDEWNPMFVAPVFTALEYASFRAFGVGVRQARLVSEAAGLISVALFALGFRRLAGVNAALIAGALLATNYVYVMYDRAAIMEALMVGFMVASWYCTTRSPARASWGALAGIFAVLAFFTKAAAAFYIGALGLLALVELVDIAGERRAAAAWTLAGLAIAGGAVAVFFVLPHWTDYRFYNWQMSVTRKPSYDLRSIVDRITNFPIYNDFFTDMWGEVIAGLAAAWAVLIGWRRSSSAERLLLLWLALGVLEMLIHDVGNERRFVQLIPPFVGLTALALGRGRLLPEDVAAVPRRTVWLAVPAIFYSAYIAAGAMTRVPFPTEVKVPVRTAFACAALITIAIVAAWPALRRWLAAGTWTLATAVMLAALLAVPDLVQFGEFAAARTYKNYAASIALEHLLAPGTLVQGKLANGLSLENRIRPIFIGHGFGNYADRKNRWDVRYILTYITPRIGYEGDQILDVLDAYPGWHVVRTFDVAESPGGHDTAGLIEKRASH
jgi:4-amino-4-deoxy-L-arabinose transferase-like glycosyltransferase